MGPKLPCLVTFGLKIESNIVIFEISAFEFVELQTFRKKQKSLNLGPKVLYFGIFGLELKNNILIFEISTLEFVKLQNFVEKMKISKFGSKNALCRYFWTGIWKKYFHTWNQHPRICLIAKLGEKMKIP